MPVSVRLAGADDGVSLAELRWRWRVDERAESGLERAPFVAAFARWTSDHAGSHLAWLAEDDGYPIGMAWLAIVERIPGPGEWLRLSGNLQSVYVVPERRGGGAGRLLIDAAVRAAKARNLEYLTVHPSERSFPLYRRVGFTDYPGVLELRFNEGRS